MGNMNTMVVTVIRNKESRKDGGGNLDTEGTVTEKGLDKDIQVTTNTKGI